MAGDGENQSNELATARNVIEAEVAALTKLSESLNDEFIRAIDLIAECKGYAIVTGVGKSGHVGRKIAATLASTGAPAFFVHPTEASHGDLGMIKKDAVVIAISNSGETRELRDLLIFCRREKTPVIAITGRRKSFLGDNATVTLVLPPAPEACPNELAPTSTTTMTLALGDAIAVAAMKRRNFSREDFGARHPGGALGMQLQPISEWIASYDDAPNPISRISDSFVDVLKEISKGRCGAVTVVDEKGAIAGFITDGDIRRAVSDNVSPQKLTAGEFLSKDPLTISPNERIGAAVEIFNTRRISQVVVVEDEKPIAIIHVKDLMQAGYF
ncbi:MAG: KpsF/GutQ family sugar-phosphate isomerase [Marinicaulis sp.]|nr:KpsF/GutQ family sugar-phosphate isomerase [Marinicaulis sp.]